MELVSKENIKPLYSQPPAYLFEVATSLKTPALVYDYHGMQDVVERMQEDLKIVPHTKLNLALKAIHTPQLLKMYSNWNLGCDVASKGEYLLAKEAGFSEISITGPAFNKEDMKYFQEENLIIDFDSISQIRMYGEMFSGSSIGLRVRVPLPPEHESNATFGKDSRFGVDINNPELKNVIDLYDLKICRLHVHTGQMTPESMLYKVNYLLSIASEFCDITTIDLGGGLFHFYVDRMKAREALTKLKSVQEEWTFNNGRKMKFRFEPGGALLAGCGYLISTILANEKHEYFDSEIVTMDSSAWNIAPWHKPQIIALNNYTNSKSSYLIAGNTLYEGDFFGKDVKGESMSFMLPADLKVGDTLLFTASGAYTMTNAREFNRIPLPSEYILKSDQIEIIKKELDNE